MTDSSHPDDSTLESLIGHVADEFTDRLAAGEEPTVAEYAERYPELAEVLEHVLPALFVLRPSGDDPSVTPTIPAGNRQDFKHESDAPATRFGNYRILTQIGSGGGGVVYQAHDTRLGRVVALKLLRTGDVGDMANLERFRSEAQAIAQLQHPNIVQIYEIGEHDGRHFIALEYMEDGSLSDRLKDGPLPAVDAARLVEQIARAMHLVHRAEIIHRDLKPANVLLGSRGQGVGSREESLPFRFRLESSGAETIQSDRQTTTPTPYSLLPNPSPKITDFGLLKRLDFDSGQTQTGAIVGTPSYMAPEQTSGDGVVGPAADIYALGAILYESITARPPFRGTTALETLQQVRNQDPVPPRQLQPTCPRDVETICLKCLHKDPPKRYADAAALADDLQAFLDGHPIAARPITPFERAAKWVKRRPVAAALIAVSTLAAVALLITLLVSNRLINRANTDLANSLAKQKKLTEKAAKEEKRANTQAKKATENTYYAGMQLALGHLNKNNIVATEKTLDELCPADRRGPEWHWLKRQCRLFQYSLQQATGKIRDVAFSPKQQQIATVRLRFVPDKKDIMRAISFIELWQMPSLKPVRTWRFDNDADAVLFSPDGKLLAASGRFGLVVWDVEKGKEHLALPSKALFPPRYAFAGDGRSIIAVGKGVLQKWQAPGGKKINELALPDWMLPTTVVFSADGKRFAGEDRLTGNVVIFDTESAKETQRIKTLSKFSRPLAFTFSTAGKHLAAATRDTVFVWHLPDGKLIKRINPVPSEITRLAFLRGDRHLAAGDINRLVTILDLVDGSKRDFRGHSGVINVLASSADGKWLASGSSQDPVRIWDVIAATETASSEASQFTQFSGNGRRMAVVRIGRVTRQLALCDSATGKQLFPINEKAERRAISLDEKIFVEVMPGSTDIAVRALPSGRLLRRLAGQLSDRHNYQFTNDSKRLLVSCSTASVFRQYTLWDVQSGEKVFTRTTPRGETYTFSPCGNYYVTRAPMPVKPKQPFASPQRRAAARTGRKRGDKFIGAAPRYVDVRRVADDEVVLAFPNDIRTGFLMSFSASGRFLSWRNEYSQARRSIEVWDLKRAAKVASFAIKPGIRSPLNRLSSSGKYLAIHHSNRVIIFDAATQKQLHDFQGVLPSVWDESWISDEDNEILIQSGDRKTVFLYDLKSGKPLAKFSDDKRITPFVYLKNKNEVLTRGNARRKDANGRFENVPQILRWDLKTGAIVQTLENLRYTSPMGNYVAQQTKMRSPNQLYVSDVATGRVVYHINDAELRGMTGAENDTIQLSHHNVALNRDGSRLAVRAQDCKVFVIHLTDESVQHVFHSGKNMSEPQLQFSPGGNYLALASGLRLTTSRQPLPSELRIWNLDTGKETVLNGPVGGQRHHIAFAGDKRLAWIEDETLKVVDLANGAVSWETPTQSPAPAHLQFSPNGRWLAFTNQGSPLAAQLHLWDANSGEKVLSIKATQLGDFAFHPNGQLLAYSFHDPNQGAGVRIVNLADKNTLQQMFGHAQRIDAMQFSPDGRRIFTASLDRSIKIWNSATGQELLTLAGHTEPVRRLFFDPGNSWLTSYGLREVRLWRFDALAE